MNGRVTIAIPYYGCPGAIERCVQSALAQTYRNLLVVVVGDGEVPPVLSTDRRLVVYTLDRNHGGAPFAQQVALLATPDPWYAPLGADDWLERGHLANLMRERATAVATGVVWWHRPERKDAARRKVWYEVGLFRTERLRAFGGYDPSERVAQDNLVLGLLERYGGLKVYRGEPTYHRLKVEGAMSSSAETGAGSKTRLAAERRNGRHLEAASRVTAAELASLRAKRSTPELRAELARHVDRLSRILWKL